jgi:hypothetical protein
MIKNQKLYWYQEDEKKGKQLTYLNNNRLEQVDKIK